FRLALLRWIWPSCAARINAGSAVFIAANAVLRSPDEMASSTCRTALRMRERRAWLILVRRAILRVALRAELVLAMSLRVVAAEAVRITQKIQRRRGHSPPAGCL